MNNCRDKTCNCSFYADYYNQNEGTKEQHENSNNLEKLKTLSGKPFNIAYVDLMIVYHQSVIGLAVKAALL